MADLHKTEAIVADLDPESKADLDAQRQALMDLDAHRSRYYAIRPDGPLKSGWDRATRLHVLWIRRFAWLTELSRRATDF